MIEYRTFFISLQFVNLFQRQFGLSKCFLFGWTKYWFFALFLVMLFTGIAKGQAGLWKEVDEGLYLGDFDAPQKSKIGDSKVTIIKIDPNYYLFKLFCASENGRVRRTARQWCKKFNSTAAINAGMFQIDGITSVGYMKNFDHVNNSRLNKDNAVFVFNRVDTTVPEVQIIDRRCQNFDKLRFKYNTLIQGIRMVSCHQYNVWSQQPKQWSMVAVGMDTTGHVLFIFTRSPYSVHDFINILLSLPISIYNAMDMDGGPVASLYFSANGVELEKVGSYETRYYESDANKSFMRLPNVIGIVKKSK